MSYELCHRLPLVDGRAPNIGFVDKNARLAAIYMKDLVAKTLRSRGATREQSSAELR